MGSKHAILLAAGLFMTQAGFGASDSAPAPAKTGSTVAQTQRHRHLPIVGRASWYGHGFQGKKTASGEPYNMYELTAASKTLPLGSYAKVTNLQNHRWILVKINDRGPYVGDRILDLSYGAAKALSLAKTGVQKVAIQPVTDSEGELYALLDSR